MLRIFDRARWRRIPSFLRHVGPGVVTGAADDDPSGIAANLRVHPPRAFLYAIDRRSGR